MELLIKIISQEGTAIDEINKDFYETIPHSQLKTAHNCVKEFLDEKGSSRRMKLIAKPETDFIGVHNNGVYHLGKCVISNQYGINDLEEIGETGKKVLSGFHRLIIAGKEGAVDDMEDILLGIIDNYLESKNIDTTNFLYEKVENIRYVIKSKNFWEAAHFLEKEMKNL